MPSSARTMAGVDGVAAGVAPEEQSWALITDAISGQVSFLREAGSRYSERVGGLAHITRSMQAIVHGLARQQLGSGSA